MAMGFDSDLGGDRMRTSTSAASLSSQLKTRIEARHVAFGICPPQVRIVDLWLRDSGVAEGMVFRRILKNGARQNAGVTPNMVWDLVNQRLRPPLGSTVLQVDVSAKRSMAGFPIDE
jgi:hypothetical protein